MPAEVRRLYRSRTRRTFAGVCGGLGEYLGIPPNLIRLVFLLAALFGGAAVPIYLLMWLIVPLEPAPSEAVITVPAENSEKGGSK